ncbi:unnamed protein product [Rotaria socialis]|uniref:Uncharacterized protein n=1 Tax=Rotaria socialis TaxID=392032 RepID=A0A817T5G4_9BILA|nr:unnamed protein product [Rotaria socialis]CAF4854849.1 unnamed protein product [Rotaria socialis]
MDILSDPSPAGIVMAVHGYENDEGVFIVTVYCCKDLSIPKTLSPPTEDKYILFETSIIFNQLEYLINSLTRPTNLQCEQIKLILHSTNQAKYLTRKMTASSVEAMNTIGELFDKTAIYSFPGTSGQDLDDIDLQSTIESRVQILEDCLKWSAIAPTRPNTLIIIK